VADTASELAYKLAGQVEAVCRHYLPNGRRAGGYWLVGDVSDTPGRSLYVRLHGPTSGRGAAGHWRDAATGEHGDLLDLIAANRRLRSLRETLDEARDFLSLPPPKPAQPLAPVPTGSPEAARRLFAMAKPISHTVADTYLRTRGITALLDCAALRFHPRCYYRPDEDDPNETRTAWPAIVAAVTDVAGTITGAHRTWLDPSGRAKAPVVTPRRAMGHLLGNGVRFSVVTDMLAAGEGIETMLSLRQIMPSLSMIAALSSAHLAALVLPASLRRLYIARDNDPAGKHAAETLTGRAQAEGIEALTLTPSLGDFNDDLKRLGIDALAAAIRVQLAPEDVARFWVAQGHTRRTG